MPVVSSHDHDAHPGGGTFPEGWFVPLGQLTSLPPLPAWKSADERRAEALKLIVAG